ncbi:MAG: hypothetical protein AAF085_04990 [Planctomycetota bacterium]
MDEYEQIVARVMHHLEDGAFVLSHVQDEASAKRAAGMFVEASDRVVSLRRQMLEANPEDRIPPYIVIAYGPRYFFVRFETDQQVKRIKAMDEAVSQPLRDVLGRLDKRVEKVEDEFDAEKRGR